MRIWLLILFTTLCVNVSADDDLLEDLSDESLPTSDETPTLSEPSQVQKNEAIQPAQTSDPYAPPPPRPEPRSEAQVRDPRTPKYHFTRPNWGFELTFSMDSLGKQLFVPTQSETAKAILMEYDYQPAFLQSIGVIGIGPSIAFYPIFGTGVTETAFSLWSVGAHIRYQARFFRQQVVVPVVGYNLDYFTYRFRTASNGSMILQGPVFGAWILLNMFEPSSAAQLYVDYKISRSYLVAEMRLLSGSDVNLSITGSSLYFGLRFEY
jgi:hypothetical protein